MGYQQHRLSQGHVPHDRSLTLPPLQTGSQSAAVAAAATGKTAQEQIMSISFRYKIKVLCQVAPPATKNKDNPRGPLIAVEGDNPEAVKELAQWLGAILEKGACSAVNLLQEPLVEAPGGKEEAMAQYHRLAAEWLAQSRPILESIQMNTTDRSADAAMTDAASAPATTSPRSSINDDEKDEDGDSQSSNGVRATEDNHDEKSREQTSNAIIGNSDTEKMDLDKDSNKRACTATSTSIANNSGIAKPVSIVANYSLHTSNTFARLIPIGPADPYSPNDHWQWTATQWRGIIGPDLTIYVREAEVVESGRPSVEIEAVQGRPDVSLFVVKSSRAEGQGDRKMEVEASVLRRLAFEVSEWVRAFGVDSGGE